VTMGSHWNKEPFKGVWELRLKWGDVIRKAKTETGGERKTKLLGLGRITKEGTFF